MFDVGSESETVAGKEDDEVVHRWDEGGELSIYEIMAF
jgi:hypothetical protein